MNKEAQNEIRENSLKESPLEKDKNISGFNPINEKNKNESSININNSSYQNSACKNFKNEMKAECANSFL